MVTNAAIGITSINGYPLPIERQFAEIKAGCFYSVLRWWGSDETDSRASRMTAARKYDLRVENAHASTDCLNSLWVEETGGDNVFAGLEQEISDCAEFGIETLVVHLTNGSTTPPPVSAVGISRSERLIKLADRVKVKLALENVRKPEHIRYILDNCFSPYVGLCYDSGHEYFWSRDTDWLNEFITREFALHLPDNHGDKDSHLVPFDGMIDWLKKAKQIALSSYGGTITMESEMHSSNLYE